ncbi:MAG TPA: GatB/YqeY domain-containing protein [Pseudomonadales bacterium]|nr:GatB/YqeY domain-containing protein [Pseudomonadales bacterium]
MPSEIKQRVDNAVKDAMRARDKQRVGALRLMTAEMKRVEVDERIELDDARVLQIFDKLVKQRKDSLAQYKQAGRDDLAAQEQFELDLLKEFMPDALDEAAIAELVDEAIKETGATAMKDMGQVMGALRPKVQGRADMGQVSALVKSRLAGA